MGADVALSNSIDLDITMALDGSKGHSDQYGPQWQHSPQTSTWFLETATDIYMAFGGSIDMASIQTLLQ